MLSRNDLSWILSPQKGLAVENDPLFFGRKPKGKIGNRPEWNGANLTACRHKTGENKAPFGVCGYVGVWVRELLRNPLDKPIAKKGGAKPSRRAAVEVAPQISRQIVAKRSFAPLRPRRQRVECGSPGRLRPALGGHLRIYPHTHRYPHWERATLFHGAGAEPRVPRVRSPAYPSMAFSM